MHKLKTLTVVLTLILNTACGGKEGTKSADAATQQVLSSIEQQAASETQGGAAAPMAVPGIQRNAETLKNTVLSNR